MFDLILDLLPDEIGEFLGFGATGGATYLYVKKLKDDLIKGELSISELEKESKQKVSDLKVQMEKNCLSESALQYVKENF